MAQVYFNDQLIATDSIHGVLHHSLLNEEIVITYQHKKNKYYTIIMYADDVHSMIINVKGDDFDTGDIIVEYAPFRTKNINYDATIFIYEQINKNKLPANDFDLVQYAKENKLTLLYVIEFTILQHIKRKTKSYNKK
jgi:hypothetical protein